MKKFLILVFFIMSCSIDKPLEQRPMDNVEVQEEVVINFRVLAASCLRDLLVGEDAGGVWTIHTKPGGSILLDTDLSGDNPCIEFGDFGCGIYELKYTVTTDCCEDFVIIRVRKKCCEVVGVISCSI